MYTLYTYGARLCTCAYQKWWTMVVSGDLRSSGRGGVFRVAVVVFAATATIGVFYVRVAVYKRCMYVCAVCAFRCM